MATQSEGKLVLIQCTVGDVEVLLELGYKHTTKRHHSPLYLSLLLCIYPAVNIQTSAGDHPSNTGECQTPHH